MGPKFHTIPDEVIIRIFRELDVYDILNCSLTCRVFHETIRDALILQYCMELAIAGVEDGDMECQLSTAERLARLKTIEHGWDNLHFRQKHRVRLPLSNVWELFGGVLAHGMGAPLTRGLSFTQLPSAVRGTPVHTWQHRDMGIEIRDFAMDPAQDLAVLIAHPVIVPLHPDGYVRQFMIHLRTMSNGRSHPNASHPMFRGFRCPNVLEFSFVIQIMGDFLAVLSHSPPGSWTDRLFIWDWKSGRHITDLVASPARGKIDSFSFLSPRHFVIARFSPQPDQNPPALAVYDFLTTNHEGSQRPQLLRTYELPHIAQDAFTISIITRSDPSPEASSQSLNSHGRPFYTAPTSRLLAVSIDFLWHLEEIYSCMLFVHHSSLLEGLETGLPLDHVIVPWENWGPRKTRLIRTNSNEPTWVCYVHGTRYVRLEPSGPEGIGTRSSYLRMLDFNPLALRRARKNLSSKDTTSSPSEGNSELLCSTIVLESQPTILLAYQSAFAQNVVTTLPYRDVRSRDTFRYSAVMIDEDCVVGRYADQMNNDAEFLCI